MSAAFIKRADSLPVVVLHEPPDLRFHFFNRHLLTLQLIDLLLLHYSEDAFRSAVVKATTDSAHTLNQTVFS